MKLQNNFLAKVKIALIKITGNETIKYQWIIQFYVLYKEKTNVFSIQSKI